MEHDILTEPPRTLRRRSCPVRMHDDAAPAAFLGPALSGPGGVPKRLLCLPALETRPGEYAGGTCADSVDVWIGAPLSGIAGRRVFGRGVADQAAAQETWVALCADTLIQSHHEFDAWVAHGGQSGRPHSCCHATE